MDKFVQTKFYIWYTIVPKNCLIRQKLPIIFHIDIVQLSNDDDKGDLLVGGMEGGKDGHGLKAKVERGEDHVRSLW